MPEVVLYPADPVSDAFAKCWGRYRNLSSRKVNANQGQPKQFQANTTNKGR
jgi:hypothetical protein